ncbi:MAG TPA: hydrogenase maturation protease [Candidatus Sulfomarinibacteraceae bacterium]|nr:hydrogenase maturation protease [Candidatus Sulfomarinibacteraceae bacterium]
MNEFMTPRLIIGVGNEMRGDDGAGLLVARLLQVMSLPGVDVLQRGGEGSALMDAWQGYADVILVDAACSPYAGTDGAACRCAPGTIHRFDLADGPLPAILSSSLSSHAFGVAGAIDLARRLQRLPPHLTVYAIEGQDFSLGQPLSPPVFRAAYILAHHLCARSSDFL